MGAATLGVMARDTNKVYGSTQGFAGTEFSLSGSLYNGNTLTNVNLSSTGTPASATVGSYAIVPSAAQGDGLTNYTILYTNGTLTVTGAVLTVTANNATRSYGTADPVFGGTITGIRNGDNITATYATTATIGSPVGIYPIVPPLVDSDSKLPNYVVTTNSGTLTITVPAAPTILSIVRSPDNTNVTITWTSVSNCMYWVQYKSSLPGTSWLDLSPDVTATGSTAPFTDHPGPASQRFYRTVVP